MDRPRIAALIPAYNEAENIGAVLDVLIQSPLIDEIVVVDDASQDNTSEVVRTRYPAVKLFSLAYNLGKAGALEEAFIRAEADIFMFLDADLIGLTQDHISRMLEPILFQDYDCTMGIFVGGEGHTDFAHWFTPGLSGQRAFRRQVIEAMPSFRDKKYAIEVAINKFLEKSEFKIKTVELPGMTQVIKEKKMGPVPGFLARMKMYGQILKFVLGLDERKRELRILRSQLLEARRKLFNEEK